MSEPAKRRRLQVRLSTALLLMLIASGLVGAGVWYWRQREFKRSKAEVKALVASFCGEARISGGDPNQPSSAFIELYKRHPVQELTELYLERDEGIQYLSGTFFGILCRRIAPNDFDKVLIADLASKGAEVRMFACDALGELGNKNAIPELKKLLHDEEVVPRYTDGRVCLSAAFALAWLGNADGFPVFFDYAQRRPGEWKDNVLRHFRRFSDKDFGDDLDAWRRHFEQVAPRPPQNERWMWDDWGKIKCPDGAT